MTVCGNVSSTPQLFTSLPIAIEQKLFESKDHEIALIMRDNFAPFENHIPELAALLQKVITTTEYTNEKIQKVITELNICIPMTDVLVSLMETSLKNVIEILHLLGNEEFTHTFIRFYTEKYTNNSSSFYVNLFRAIISTNISLKERQEWVNTTINCIPLIELQRLYAELIPQITISELGKLVSLIRDEANAQPFVLEVINHYLTQGECIEHCRVFIDQLCLTIDLENPNKPLTLVYFLKELNRIGKLQDYVIEHMHTYDETSLLLVLWSLENEGVSDYITGCDLEDNPYGPAKLLTDLFKLEKQHECRATLLDCFTDPLNRRELQHLVSALLNTNSCVLPYVFTGLNDEQFEEFITYAPRTLMDDLLKNSVPQDAATMQWIVHNLNMEHDENRLELICEHAIFDRLSQDYFNQNYYTLKSLCAIFEANKNDSDNILTHFKEDIEATPPFLFALGMNDPELRPQILLAAKLLSEKQLKAITFSFSKNELCERLDELLPCLLIDQVYFVLNTLSMTFGAVYTLHKTEQLLVLYKEISDRYTTLSSKQSNDISEEELSEVLINIRRILSPINLQLKKVLLTYIPHISLFFDTDPLFIQMINSCIKYSTDIAEMFKQCSRKILSVSLEKVILTKTLIALELNSVAELKPLGLKSAQDLEILGISIRAKKVEKLRRYLQQQELASIWTFFISKELYSLRILHDRCLIETSEEAYNLKPLATKLGYVTSVETEQQKGDK